MKNQSTPPISVYVWDSFLFDGEGEGKTRGTLVSVRGRSNQALQFSVLLENGALFTGLPAHAISFDDDRVSTGLELHDCQMWDCVSDDIEVFVIDTLRYMECSVEVDSLGTVWGKYLFTIDFVGEGLSRDPVNWKQFHVVQSNTGDMLIYPQYKIQFRDKSLTEDKPLPHYKANTRHWIVGS